MKTKYGKIKNGVITDRVDSIKDMIYGNGQCFIISCMSCFLYSDSTTKDVCDKISYNASCYDRNSERYDIAYKALKKYNKLTDKT